MAAKPAMKLAYATRSNPQLIPGRRAFFEYYDLGVASATDGKMRAQVMKAISSMTKETGWHHHSCDTQFVYALKGWAELEFETGEMIRLEAGDSLLIPGGLIHNEIAASDDFEVLEVSTPGEFGTIACERPVGAVQR
jgi:quercetin dioxygenase-like cupin family protein